jgi:YD repeat-containing protein
MVGYNAASGVRPHTPNSITGIKTNTSTNTNNQDRTYTYDANGSMTKNNDKTIQWTSFNKEVNIFCIVTHGLVVVFVVEFFTPVFGLNRDKNQY